MKEATFRVRRGAAIEAEITVPGDKSISHRALMLAALTNGPCQVSGFLNGEDCLSTLAVLRQLGVVIRQSEPTTVVVEGCKGIFRQPEGDLDCGNSGTTMRLMSGLLAAQPFRSRLVGDASLSRRPMRRVVEPLGQMGARLATEGEENSPPLVIEGGSLRGITYSTPVASAQVKSAILLAGLSAEGATKVIEPAKSRDHTERMIAFFLGSLRCGPGPSGQGFAVTIPGRQTLESRDFVVPGDLSSAAFWLVAAAAMPGTRLLIRGVGLNPTRTGLLSVLLRMGARLREVVEVAGDAEPCGSLEVTGGGLHGTTIGGAEIPNVIDELPVLAVAGALAGGETIIRDAAELRVKETDRIAAVADNLRAMGVAVETAPDGMRIAGAERLKGAVVDSFGDHRIAMAFAVAGLFAKGTTTVTNTGCVATSYPGFEQTLRLFEKGGRLGPRLKFVGPPSPARG